MKLLGPGNGLLPIELLGKGYYGNFQTTQAVDNIISSSSQTDSKSPVLMIALNTNN